MMTNESIHKENLNNPNMCVINFRTLKYMKQKLTTAIDKSTELS